MGKKKDENETAFNALQELMARDAERDGLPPKPQKPAPKVPSAVKAGRKGGLKGGKARAKKLSPSKLKEIAQKGARKRWGKDRAS